MLKNSIGSLTTDKRLQALLIAFAFGAFVEGAAGFGTPVAVAGAMLAGLGFSPFYAAAICLLANTAPVAFGSIAIPITTLAGDDGTAAGPIERGRGSHLRAGLVICAGVSDGGDVGLEAAARACWPAAALCGVTFAGTQFLVSNFVGPQLTDILASSGGDGVAGDADSVLAAGTRPGRSTVHARREAMPRGLPTRCWWCSCWRGAHAADATAFEGAGYSVAVAGAA